MKQKLVVIALLLMAAISSLPSYAKGDKQALKEKIGTMTEAQKESRIAEITARVQEIKDMDRSTLSSNDKKALRHELKDMNKEAKALGNGGIYISLAGIIIIILVLILVL